MNALTAILNIVARALGIVEKRQELKNAADVKEAKKAQDIVNSQNRMEEAVADEDETKVRQSLS